MSEEDAIVPELDEKKHVVSEGEEHLESRGRLRGAELELKKKIDVIAIYAITLRAQTALPCHQAF